MNTSAYFWLYIILANRHSCNIIILYLFFCVGSIVLQNCRPKNLFEGRLNISLYIKFNFLVYFGLVYHFKSISGLYFCVQVGPDLVDPFTSMIIKDREVGMRKPHFVKIISCYLNDKHFGSCSDP